MKRKTRKTIVWTVLALIIVALSFTVHRSVQYDKGSSTNYALNSQSVHNKNGILVLCYHRVLSDSLGVKIAQTLSNNTELHDFAVNRSFFIHQMNYIRDHHIKVITGHQMYEMVKHRKQHPIRGRYVVITFDDMDRSVVENAFPTLNKYKFPYTSFIVTGNTSYYRGGSKFASWKQVRDSVHRSHGLMTLGLHTNNMHYLTKKLVPIFDLPNEFNRFKRDFYTSRQVMHKQIGYYGSSFAYPYGGGNKRTNDFLFDQHLEWIASLDDGIVDNKTTLHGLQSTPRIIVNTNSWPSLAKWIRQ